jgi:hypothetical protein
LLLPPPEYKVRVRDMPQFLTKDPLYNSESIDRFMRTIRGRYIHRAKAGAASQPTGASTSRPSSVSECILFLYDWEQPDPLSIGGIIPRRTGLGASHYFLIDDGTVLGYGLLTRMIR